MLIEPKVLSVVGVLAPPDVRGDDILAACVPSLGAAALATPAREFGYTGYYEAEMGRVLERFWFCGDRLLPASELAAWKLAARELEDRWRDAAGRRRVNLDPGYMTPLQLALATTKSLPQAVYLRDGVSAVVELLYRQGRFEPLPWTYPDYREAAEEGVFEPFRVHLLRRRRGVEP